MRKLIAIIFVIPLFFSSSCSLKNKLKEETKDNGPGAIMLSISSVGVNFLDFPFTVKSIVLTHSDGSTQLLTAGFSVNLANFGENAAYILVKEGLPTGRYSRIMINLAFNQDSTVTYFDTDESEQPVTQHLLSQTGKKLGVDHSNFLINMPFFGDTFEVSSSRITHLNIGWNLNASTEVFKSEGNDWIIEFKPLVKASSIKESMAIDFIGKYRGVKGGRLSLQTAFDESAEGVVKVDLGDATKYFSDNKILSRETLASMPEGGFIRVNGQVSLVKGKSVFTASKVVYFSNEETIIKGLVTEITETTYDIIGANISSPDYLTQSNKTYKLPASSISAKDRSYSLFSNIQIKLMTDQIEALFRGGAYQPSGEGKILMGARDEVVLDSSAQVINEKSGADSGSDTDVFYFTFLDDTEKSSTDKKDKKITLISNNGISVSEEVSVQFAEAIKDQKTVTGQLFRGRGYFRLSGDSKKLMLETMTEVSGKALDTFSYDFKYDSSSVWDTFGANDSQPTVEAQAKTAIIDFEELENAKNAKESEVSDKKSILDVDYRLVFSRPLEFTSEAGKNINCKSFSMNIPNTGTTYTKDSATVIFELMQNDEEWDKGATVFDGINKAEFNGDYSTADILYSKIHVQKWFNALEDVSDKKLLIHSIKILAEPLGDEDDVTEGEHCTIKPTYVSIRWIREGTILDAYKAAFKGKVWRDTGIVAGLVVGGLLAAALVAAVARILYKKIKKGIINKISKIGVNTGAAVDIDIDIDTKLSRLTVDEFKTIKNLSDGEGIDADLKRKLGITTVEGEAEIIRRAKAPAAIYDTPDGTIPGRKASITTQDAPPPPPRRGSRR